MAEGCFVIELAGFELKVGTFLVQEEFFDVEPQTILVKGSQIGALITDDIPRINLAVTFRPSNGKMNRTQTLLTKPHAVKETRLAWLGAQTSHFEHRHLTRSRHPSDTFDPNAKVPMEISGGLEQTHLEKAANGEQDHLNACG